MTTRPGRWLGPLAVARRTRRGRRSGDAGELLHGLVGNADTAVGLRIGGQAVLLLTDPMLVPDLLISDPHRVVRGPGLQLARAVLGDGLLTSEGTDHDRARRLVAPAFSPARLAAYRHQFTDRSDRFFAGWTAGREIDAHRELSALTLDLVAHTLLGIDINTDAGQIRTALESALDAFGDQALAFGRRSTPAPQLDAELTAGLHRVVAGAIDDRVADSKQGQDRGDVVSALVAAMQSPGGLTRSEVHDHIVTLLLAGHETTANALSWTLLLLSQNPDVDRRLHTEVAAVGPGQTPAYARAVLTEAMRLYPPAWILGRTLLRARRFGEWTAPAGAVVAVSPLLLHRDPRWFDTPEQFDPDRWLDERRRDVPRHAYLPFGTGPRACIGEQFAWLEATLVLGALVRRWRAELRPGHVAVPHYRITLRPGNGLPMTLHPR
jgi:cytochrome P450